MKSMHRMMLLVLLAVGGMSMGDEPKAASRQIDRWLVQLADKDADVRDEARMGLMGIKRDDLPLLKDAIQKHRPLLPAQVVVLRDIVTQVYLAGEPYDVVENQGFLGLLYSETVVDPKSENTGLDDGRSRALVVIERVPGFNAFRGLMDGDVILSVVGRAAFEGQNDFKEQIRGVPPGKEVNLEVLRQGRLVKVTISPSPRPAGIDLSDEALRQFKNDRRQKADAYWEKTFAPLLEAGVG